MSTKKFSSVIWNYFEIINDECAMCKICDGNYSRKGKGTISLKNHLQRKHPEEYDLFLKGNSAKKRADEMSRPGTSLQKERSDSLSSHRTSTSEEILKLERNKVLRHRTLVKDVVRRTLIEIAEEGHGFTLCQAVNILSNSATSLKTVKMENDQLKKLLDNSKNESLTKRYHRSLQLHKCDETVASLKDEIRDSQINSKAQLCYVEKWLCASTNALQFRHKIKPATLPRQDHEQRVHDEIVRAYELHIKEREELLSYWKTRYTDDIMTISDNVIHQREMLKVTITRREELTKLYNYHAGEMRAWLTFKKERAERLAREQRSRLAASRIQAWWRGLMVPRALGAFKHLRNSKKSAVKTKKK